MVRGSRNLLRFQSKRGHVGDGLFIVRLGLALPWRWLNRAGIRFMLCSSPRT